MIVEISSIDVNLHEIFQIEVLEEIFLEFYNIPMLKFSENIHKDAE